VPLLQSLGRAFPKLRHIFADRVYRGQKLINAIADFGKMARKVKGWQTLATKPVDQSIDLAA
jgi:hypothetical protein